MTHWHRVQRVMVAWLLTVVAVQAVGHDALRVACIGDGVTYGQGLHDRETESYPAQLGALLGEGWKVQNFGAIDATVLREVDASYRNQPQWEGVQRFVPHIVIVMLGMHATSDAHWEHRAEIKADYLDMLEKLRRMPSGPRIWLCTPMPVARNVQAVSAKRIAEDIVPLMHEIADEVFLPVIDLHSLLAAQPGVMLATRPTAFGSRRIAEIVHAEIAGTSRKAMLEQNRP